MRFTRAAVCRRLILLRTFGALDTWAEKSRGGPTFVIASINFKFVCLLQVKIDLRGQIACLPQDIHLWIVLFEIQRVEERRLTFTVSIPTIKLDCVKVASGP